jgi:hypothetical protein
MGKSDSMITDDMLGPEPEVGQAIEFSSDDEDENEGEGDEEEASQESARSRGRGRGREVRQVGNAAHLTVAELGEEVVAAHTRSHDHDHDEQEVQDDQEDQDGREEEEATPRAGSRSLPVVVEEAEEEEEEEDEEEDENSSSDEKDEEEDSSSDEDSDDESEEEEDEDDDEEELDPELLLARALQSAQAKKSAVTASGSETTPVVEEKGQLDGEEEDVWVLDPEAKEREEKRKRERSVSNKSFSLKCISRYRVLIQCVGLLLSDRSRGSNCPRRISPCTTSLWDHTIVWARNGSNVNVCVGPSRKRLRPKSVLRRGKTARARARGR